MSVTPSARQGYHHGNAREALLAAATELLERVGATSLSLRQVAEHAGLSRQAPYNHFADKEALLAELARTGFERLRRALVEAGKPADQFALEHAADAYIGCARATPAMFRLMFSRELMDLSRFPETAAASAASFDALTDIIASFAPAERIEELSLAAWSLAHGYATLCIEIDLDAEDRQTERARLFARMIRNEVTSGNRPA